MALQPLDAIGIEVVGGFIEQQEVGFGHQRRRQGQPLAVAPREVAHPAAHIPHPQPLQHLADLLLQAPGLALIHAAVEAAQLGQQGAVVAAMGMGLGQGLAHGRIAAQQLHLFAAAGKHLVEHGALWIQLRFLAHQHHAAARQHPPLTGTGGLQARQHLQQGAFAGAVGANQPQPLPLAHVQIQVFKQGADAVILADTHQADQTHAAALLRRFSR